MDEPTLDIEDNTNSPEGNIFLEPITTQQLPPNTTIGSTISFTDTLQGNIEEFGAFILFELKKQHPESTYEEVTEMSKDSSITNPVKEKLMAEAQSTFVVTNEIQPPEPISMPINNSGVDDNKFFQERANNFLLRSDNYSKRGGVEVSAEEFGNTQKLYIGGGYDTQAFQNINSSGVYGDSNEKPTYFTTDYTVACSHINDEQPVLIEIDCQELLKQRKAYRDPESLYIKDESGKTFITFNGIPTNVISRILLIKKIE